MDGGSQRGDNGDRDTRVALDALTWEEKAALCSGRDYWTVGDLPAAGIPPVVMADGPHGLRRQVGAGTGYSFTDVVPATCFPTAVTLASTWDVELLREVGTAVGREARTRGVGVLLGPAINIKRSPLCGRNFEYFSEDPHLTGHLAAAFIRGVQGTGVGVSLKHFAVNNQETRRMVVDAVVDERALREIYLAGFEWAVKEGRPWTVMAAYNRVNGKYCCEHGRLLTDILRGEWGFDGLVVSDWGAVADRVASLAAGLDLEMPGVGDRGGTALVRALRENTLPEADLDRAAGRVLALIDRLRGSDAQDVAAVCTRMNSTGARRMSDTEDAHHALARRTAAEGAVLLKNERNILPLDPGRTVGIVGALAKQPRYQGAGSSQVRPTRLDTAFAAMVAKVGAAGRGGARGAARGVGLDVLYAPGYGSSDRVDGALLAEAREVAKRTDVVVVFAGLPSHCETEGVDRRSMALPPSHDAVVEAVAAVNPNVVVVLMNGAPVEMPWHERVAAIVEAYLGGQAGGSAIADILYGDINPSGRLAETFPRRLSDHPTCALFPGGPRSVEYRESIYVGYRYFDSAGLEVLYPFGHGLSYTQHEYAGLRVTPRTSTGGDVLTVSLSVTNTGGRAGKEVVQLYVHHDGATTFRPTQELKGFTKVELGPGETKPVCFALDRRSFAYWDVGLHQWRVEPGGYEIRVGASSRDIRLVARVEVPADGEAALPVPAPASVPARLSPYYDASPDSPFTASAFEALYGAPLPVHPPEPPGRYTLNTPLADMRRSSVARVLRAAVGWGAWVRFRNDRDNPLAVNIRTILDEMPLRMLAVAGGGRFTAPVLEGLLFLINGRYVRGLRVLAGARRRPMPVPQPGTWRRS